jgi:hypothetical protein
MTSFFETHTAPFDRREPHTVIVLGPPRSGTSMISGILRLMGMYMGECNTANNEDPRFNKRNSVGSIRKLIEKNNDQRPVWGWKEPSTHTYLSSVLDSVRNPFFIVSVRNVLAAAGSKLKHTDSGDVEQLIGAYSRHYMNISTLLRSIEAPTIFVNFEQAVTDPLELIDHLSDRLQGSSLDTETRDRIIQYCLPTGYKAISDFI